MTEPTPSSPWRLPLVREIAMILAIKLVLLFTIKAIWFTAPTAPDHGSARISERLLGKPGRPSSPLRAQPEEAPR